MAEVRFVSAAAFGRPAEPQLLVDALASDGILVVRGLEPQGFSDLFDQIAVRRRHRDSRTTGLTSIAPKSGVIPGQGYDGFTHAALPLHTDGSAASRPPALLGMYCLTASAEGGGQTVVSDGQEVWTAIQQMTPAMADTLRTPVVTFGRHATYTGAVVEYVGDSQLAIRYRDDGLAHFGVVRRASQSFAADAARRATIFPLKNGDAVFLRNGRWLHGREGFQGDRTLLRLAGDPLPNVASLLGWGFRAPVPSTELVRRVAAA